MLMAQGLGAIACSAIVGRVTKRFSPAPLLGLSILLFGMLQVAIALAASVPVTLAGTLLGGCCVLFIVANMSTLMQTSIPDIYRGRVFGTHRATAALVGLIGSLVAGVLGDSVGIRTTLGVGGVLFMTAGVLGLTTLGPVMRSSAQAC
jgi:MFS family permease